MAISFAASSSGPLKPTKKLSYPDIYIGIPSALLCIEMAFFAVLHIFAFPWTPYSLKHGANGYTSSSNSVENGASPTIPMTSRKYKGFFYAIFDAFNPWDVVKASARGLRWMFVRYKHRHDDSSYKPAPAAYKLGSSNDDARHDGTVANMSMPSATNLDRPYTKPSTMPATGGPYNAMTTEDDTAGLLNNSARPGHSQSPPRRPSYNDEFAPGDDGAVQGLDLGTAGRVPPHPAGRYAPSENAWQHDTSYQGAHPSALQPGGRYEGWGNSRERRGSMDGAASTNPPPSYHTVEQRGWI